VAARAPPHPRHPSGCLADLCALLASHLEENRELPHLVHNTGELLYWITSHYPGENGHWFSYEEAQTHPDVAPNHAAFFREALAKPVAEREALFKERAKPKPASQPQSLLLQLAVHLSRLAFGFPAPSKVKSCATTPSCS
jgi:hypothetical protein